LKIPDHPRLGNQFLRDDFVDIESMGVDTESMSIVDEKGQDCGDEVNGMMDDVRENNSRGSGGGEDNIPSVNQLSSNQLGCAA
jgi:hypothetical protein